MTKNVTPNNINNYNKFLIELDKNSKPNHSFDVSIKGDKLDMIVHNINEKYDNELLLTLALLTGSIPEDSHIIKNEKTEILILSNL